MEKKQDYSAVIGVAAALGFGAWFLFGGGIEAQVERDTQNINNKVAGDAVTQYQMVERNGSPIEKCNAATMAAGAFLQAKDEPNYAKWRGVQEQQCKAAGLPN